MKYSGKIGFAESSKSGSPGVWSETVVIERSAKGDVLKNTARYIEGDKIIDDRTVSNRISIIADPYAFNHFSSIRYVTWMGIKMEVTSIEVAYPRLILTIGGEYNEEQTDSA